MIIDKQSLGSNIKHFRLRKGLSQEQLAELCDISQVHLSLIERGLRLPSFLVCYNISIVLEVSMDVLVGSPILYKKSNALPDDNKALLLQLEILINKLLQFGRS